MVQSNCFIHTSLIGPQYVQYRGFKSGSRFNIRYQLYADDVQIFCQVNSVLDCIILFHLFIVATKTCCLLILATGTLCIFIEKSIFIFVYILQDSILNRPDITKDLRPNRWKSVVKRSPQNWTTLECTSTDHKQTFESFKDVLRTYQVHKKYTYNGCLERDVLRIFNIIYIFP